MIGPRLVVGSSAVSGPVASDELTDIVAEAIEMLRIAHGGEAYNSADRLTLLASLAAGANALIPDAIADAVDQGFTWEQIAHCAGLSPAAARRRHAARTPDRRPPPPD